MAVYCGQQTKYAKVNFGEPGTTQHRFYLLITIAYVFVAPIVTPITFITHPNWPFCLWTFSFSVPGCAVNKICPRATLFNEKHNHF
jgi:hypothetical protein